MFYRLQCVYRLAFALLCLAWSSHVAERPGVALSSLWSAGPGGGAQDPTHGVPAALSASSTKPTSMKIAPLSTQRKPPANLARKQGTTITKLGRKQGKSIAESGDASATITTSILDPYRDAVTIQEGNAATAVVTESSSPSTTEWSSKSPTELPSASTPASYHTAGCLATVIAASTICMACVALFIILFGMLRRRFPVVYAGNAIYKKVPFDLPNTFFGWLAASYSLRMDEVTTCVGLDQALLLEFTHFGMWLLGTLSAPLLFVMAPLHASFGGNSAQDDQLGRLGMGNIVHGHPWLFWVHATLVWFVVITVQRMIYWSQERFIERRRRWLKLMPVPRATSILVRGVPKQHCTDAKLKEYFRGIFEEDVVEAVHIVKDTSKLCEFLGTKAKADHEEARESQDHERPQPVDTRGGVADSSRHYDSLCADAAQAVKEERARIKAAALRGDASIFTDNAFVTFKTRRASEMALKVTFSPEGTLHCEIPPDPADVIYTDFREKPAQGLYSRTMGYACIGAVFLTTLPCVLGIAYITNIENVASHHSFFAFMAKRAWTATLWDAMVGSWALQLLASFVPALFMTIASRFFALEAHAQVQHMTHIWYFWFLVLYVLLVTALGSSVISTVDEIVAYPASIFHLLAATMPYATHFYLSFLPVLWATHAWDMLRLPVLLKFLSFRALYPEDRAKDLSEPEDQGYHGMGSRSARFSFVVALALVYCQLTPLINLLGFIELAFCRLIYGYLVVFAEVRKADLGGAFWVTNLMNIQRCVQVYIILMSGFLCFRDSTYWPCAIAASSYVYWTISYSRFTTAFCWESLPLEDLVDLPSKKIQTSMRTTYEQPELCED